IAAAERISFRQVNRQTGNRLRQQLVDTVTGEVVEHRDKTRGYETGENRFLVVEDEELAAAEQEARARPFRSAPAAPPIVRQAEELASVQQSRPPASREAPFQPVRP